MSNKALAVIMGNYEAYIELFCVDIIMIVSKHIFVRLNSNAPLWWATATPGRHIDRFAFVRVGQSTHLRISWCHVAVSRYRNHIFSLQ